MKFVDLMVWGKKFTLPVEVCGSPDSKIDGIIDEAILQFSINSSVVLDDSRKNIEEYAIKQAVAVGLSPEGTLLDYITPHMLIALHNPNGSINIAILCGLTYDPEHDIAIIYKGQEFIEVGSQDLVVWW